MACAFALVALVLAALVAAPTASYAATSGTVGVMPVDVTPSVSKKVTGRAATTSDVFYFTLDTYDTTTVAALDAGEITGTSLEKFGSATTYYSRNFTLTGDIAKDASKSLGLGTWTFSKAGTYSFEIIEDGASSGWTQVGESWENVLKYRLTVKVTDNGKGALVATQEWSIVAPNTAPDGAISADKTSLTITNSYIWHAVAVTADPAAGGTASAGATELASGAGTTLTAAAVESCHFVRWEVVSGDATIADATSATTTLTVGDSDAAVKAVFAACSCIGGTWVSDSSDHWQVCDTCKQKFNEGAHTFVTVIDKEATATTAGSKHEECSVCGYKSESVTIPSTGSSDTSSSSSTASGSSSKDKLAATGDTAAPLAATALALAGAALTAAAFVARRRNNL